MARECSICGKGSRTGYQVSHAHNRNKKIWFPNVQSVRVVANGTNRRISVCTNCLKSNRVQKAV